MTMETDKKPWDTDEWDTDEATCYFAGSDDGRGWPFHLLRPGHHTTNELLERIALTLERIEKLLEARKDYVETD
jgi:hypothetical protein